VNMLIDGRTIVYQAVLAQTVGLVEAVILQQTHYWLGRATHEHDGTLWVFKTYAEWATEVGCTPKQARVATERLRDQGLLIAIRNPSDGLDQTRWWRIDYEALNALDGVEPVPPTGVEGSPSALLGRPSALLGRPLVTASSTTENPPLAPPKGGTRRRDRQGYERQLREYTASLFGPHAHIDQDRAVHGAIVNGATTTEQVLAWLARWRPDLQPQPPSPPGSNHA